MYVITGATGRTGTPVAEALLKNGKRVRVVGRHPDRLQPLVEKGAEPFVADLTNRAALTQAFTGAQAVYLMTPPSEASKDYRTTQDEMVAAMAHAVTLAKVPYAVTLSSVGADKPSGTGPIVGQYHLEQALNKIAGIDVLHLRSGYFMENMLAQVHVVSAMASTAGIFHPDLLIPMIAVRDVAAAAANALLYLNFEGSDTRELLGQRDISMNEVTGIIGEAVGRLDLTYTTATSEEFQTALTYLGMSQNMAGLLHEMCTAMNSGHIRHLEPRSAANTTPTSFETFVVEEFIPEWNAAIHAEEVPQIG